MRYDLFLHITIGRYKAVSKALNYCADNEALCISMIDEKKEYFLTVGEPANYFKNDPEYFRLKKEGKIRHFNPFDLGSFDVEKAVGVVRFYVYKPQSLKRQQLHPWVREFYEYFIDRCDLRLQIDGYKEWNVETRNKFKNEIEYIPILRSWTINEKPNQ